MSDEIKDITLIEAFLNNELGVKQRQSVENRRDNDPSFAQMIKDLEVVFEGTRSAYRKDIESQLKDLEAELPPVEIDEAALLMDDVPKVLEKKVEAKKPEHRRMLIGKWWYVAAVLIPLIGVMTWVFWPRQSEHERLFVEHFEKETPNLFFTFRSGTNKGLLDKADQAFKEENYTLAITSYQEAYNINQDTDILFYLGITHLGTGQVDKALESFNFYKENGNNLKLLDALSYYQALVYLRKKDLTKALMILKTRQDPESKALSSEIEKKLLIN